MTWGPKVPNPDLWRDLHRPSEDNPVCDCAGEYVCCPCTLSDALDEIARLRASHARLTETLRGVADALERALGGGGVTQERNYALAPGPDGEVILHRADCPAVRAQAEAGEPVMTMFGCEEEPPGELRRHSCLQE